MKSDEKHMAGVDTAAHRLELPQQMPEPRRPPRRVN